MWLRISGGGTLRKQHLKVLMTVAGSLMPLYDELVPAVTRSGCEDANAAMVSGRGSVPLVVAWILRSYLLCF